MSVESVEQRTILGINTKTVFSWGVVLVLIGLGSSYGSTLTKIETLEKKIEIMEKMDETNKNNATSFSDRITKLETQYETILSGIKEIKDTVKELNQK